MKILIATDGSSYGQAAIDFAANVINQPDTTEVKINSVIEPFAINEIETLVESTDDLADLTTAAARQADTVGKRLANDFRERSFPIRRLTFQTKFWAVRRDARLSKKRKNGTPI